MVAMQKGWFKEAGFTDVTTKTFTGGAARRRGAGRRRDRAVDAGQPAADLDERTTACRSSCSARMRSRWRPTSWSRARTRTSRRPRTCTGSGSACCRARRRAPTCIYLAKHYKLDEKRLQVVNMPPPEQLAALNSNNIQAMLCWEPWGYNALKTGNTDLIHTGTAVRLRGEQGRRTCRSRTRGRCSWPARSSCARIPIATRRMVEVLVRGQRYVADPKNRDEVITLFAEQTKQDQALAQAIWGDYTFDPSFDEALRASDMDQLTQFLVASGRMKSPKNPLDYTYTAPLAAVDPALVKVAGTVQGLTARDGRDRRASASRCSARASSPSTTSGADWRAGRRRATCALIVGRTRAQRSRRWRDTSASRRRPSTGARRSPATTSTRCHPTPDDTHEAIAIAAAGPARRSCCRSRWREAVAARRRIIDAARACGVDLQVSFMHRYFDEVVEARRLARRGRDRPRTDGARSATRRRGPTGATGSFARRASRDGVVDQLGVHGIDLVEQLLGDIVDVSARDADTLLPERRLARRHAIVHGGSRRQRDCHATRSMTVRMVAHEMSMIEARRLRPLPHRDLRRGGNDLAAHRARPARPSTRRSTSGTHGMCPTLAGIAVRAAFITRPGSTGVARRDAARSPPRVDALRGMRVVEAI